MINTSSKINLSKIRWEGRRSTSIWIMSLNILFFFGEYPLIRLFIIVFFLYIFEGSGICGITVSCGVREGVL